MLGLQRREVLRNEAEVIASEKSSPHAKCHQRRFFLILFLCHPYVLVTQYVLAREFIRCFCM